MNNWNTTVILLLLIPISMGAGFAVGGFLHYVKTGEILLSLLLGGFLLIAIPGAILLVRALRKDKEEKGQE